MSNIVEEEKIYGLFFPGEEELNFARRMIKDVYPGAQMWGIYTKKVPVYTQPHPPPECCVNKEEHMYDPDACNCTCDCKLECGCHDRVERPIFDGRRERSGIQNHTLAQANVSQAFRGVRFILLVSLQPGIGNVFQRIFTRTAKGPKVRQDGGPIRGVGNLGKCRRMKHEHLFMLNGTIRLEFELKDEMYCPTHREDRRHLEITDTVRVKDAMLLDQVEDSMLLEPEALTLERRAVKPLLQIAQQFGCIPFPSAPDL